jgi:hypothetical protein
MERCAALGVELVEIMPNVADPARFVGSFCDRVVGPLGQLG